MGVPLRAMRDFNLFNLMQDNEQQEMFVEGNAEACAANTDPQ